MLQFIQYALFTNTNTNNLKAYKSGITEDNDGFKQINFTLKEK